MKRLLLNSLFATVFYLRLWIKDYDGCSKIIESKMAKIVNPELFHYLKGVLYKSQGLLKDAAIEFEEALKRNSHSSSNQLALIEVLFQQEKYQQVVDKGKDFLEGLRNSKTSWREKPFFQRFHYYLAIAALKIEDFELAHGNFLAIANEDFENQADILASLGYCYLRLGEIEKAEAALRDALRLDNRLVTAKENLKLIQQQRENNTGFLQGGR